MEKHPYRNYCLICITFLISDSGWFYGTALMIFLSLIILFWMNLITSGQAEGSLIAVPTDHILAARADYWSKRTKIY